MKVIIASNEVTADDVLAIALLAVAANKTPQVVVSSDPKVIQDALEDKNVYVLGEGAQVLFVRILMVISSLQ